MSKRKPSANPATVVVDPVATPVASVPSANDVLWGAPCGITLLVGPYPENGPTKYETELATYNAHQLLERVVAVLDANGIAVCRDAWFGMDKLAPFHRDGRRAVIVRKPVAPVAPPAPVAPTEPVTGPLATGPLATATKPAKPEAPATATAPAPATKPATKPAKRKRG